MTKKLILAICAIAFITVPGMTETFEPWEEKRKIERQFKELEARMEANQQLDRMKFENRLRQLEDRILVLELRAR